MPKRAIVEKEIKAVMCCFQPPKGAPVKCDCANDVVIEAKSKDEDGPHGVPMRNSVIVMRECTHKQRCQFQKDVVLTATVGE